MKKFLDEDFLLQTGTARKLYHEYAAPMPIIDYHSHLDPAMIAYDNNFKNLTQAWLAGDHYKWRALRANGIDESYITGDKSDPEKFKMWAATVPYTLRNPLYHWTHLELQRYFNIHELLEPRSATTIYDRCSELLSREKFSVRSLLKKMQVKILCTTDDPVDTLIHHQKITSDNFNVKVFPTFRPDKALMVDDVAFFNEYINKLEAVSNCSIGSFPDFLDALKSRHNYFAAEGCVISDHGLEQIYAADYTEKEVSIIFNKARCGRIPDAGEILKFKSAMLYEFALWDFEKGWTQQYHLGALRNNNLRLLNNYGPDAGSDSIGDFKQATPLAKFLGRLDQQNKLAKTILYNVNPAGNEVMASMAGNFNDGTSPGKIQFGSAWWFMDQKDGMKRQINALSNLGLLSRFVGMLTDSRSFLSFPRHEYFRRILCNMIGQEIEEGELPADIKWTGQIIQDICYNNAAGYFNWPSMKE